MSVSKIVVRITQTGLTCPSQISKAAAIGINAVIQPILADFASLISGAAMSATTAGRIPLKAASTAGISFQSWNTIAMARMIRNEGSTAPNTAPHTPRQPPTRQPMKIAELTAISPGAACARAIMLRNSSSSIHPLRSTTSRWIRGNIA